MKPSFRPISSGVFQGYIVEPIVFTIFINDLDVGAAHIFNKVADETKL